MATEKQHQANQRNAQSSSGPKTQAGKDNVRLNALTHGLRARSLEVLPNEDPEKFAANLEAWNRELLPTNEVEAQLVRHIAVLQWKRERADRYENAVMSRRIREAIMECDCDDDDSKALLAAAALVSFDPSSEGERFRRYQLSLERDFFRTLAMLSKIRAQKLKEKQEEIGANEPNSPAPIKPNSSPNASGGKDPRSPESRTPFSHSVPAPIKPNTPAPNKANLSSVVPTPSGSIAKRPVASKGDLWPLATKSVGWLNISCQKS